MTGAREKYASPMNASRGRFRLLRRRPSAAGSATTDCDEACGSSTVCLLRWCSLCYVPSSAARPPGLLGIAIKNRQRHRHGDVPDASVHDLDDAEVARDAAEEVRVVGAEAT